MRPRLRSVKYALLRCTTHVPFVLVQNTSPRASDPASAVLSTLFSDALPMYLLYFDNIQLRLAAWLYADRSPAGLSHRAIPAIEPSSQSSQPAPKPPRKRLSPKHMPHGDRRTSAAIGY